MFDAIAAATKFPESKASVMIQHLISALAYLHSHQIVHRDVKPENLLVEMDRNHVRCLKLCDFGLAQVVREPLYTVCGTPTYVAPEILAETGYGLKVNAFSNLIYQFNSRNMEEEINSYYFRLMYGQLV